MAEWVFDADQVVLGVVAEFGDQYATGLGRVGGFLLDQAVEGVVIVLGGAVQRIGDTGAVADGVVGVAGDHLLLGVLDLGQAAQDVVFVGFVEHYAGVAEAAEGGRQQQRQRTQASAQSRRLGCHHVVFYKKYCYSGRDGDRPRGPSRHGSGAG